ncbi:tetratricopeptide repeat protein [Rosenbergiella australiborealis]|uniref:Tetratricopeptide repeat protein n=1 Tax=Rosenbergiella australiborealis TaxID=1544696 RepID=A0ABS5T6Z6_9GAMM|nr:tetratricopeptide repeat protein [Rosenbergiella australiborealis]
MNRWGVIVLIGLLVGCYNQPQVDQRFALRVYLGEQYLQLKQFANAARNFRKATEQQPKNVQGWWGLARVAEQQGDTASALSYYQRAFQIAPENPELGDNYGAFLCTLGQYDEAQRLLKRDVKTRGKENSGQENTPWLYCFSNEESVSTQ